MRKIMWVAAATVAMLGASVAFAAAPSKVRATKADELAAAASDGYLAWTQTRHGAKLPKADVFAMPVGGTAFRVNPKAREAMVGGIDGSRLIYTERRGRNWNLRFVDLATRTKLPLPAGVNTAKAERMPTISGDWLLFDRSTPRRSNVVLTNLATGEVRTLDGIGGGRFRFVFAGQVNGDYAVWHRCNRGCDLRVYRISTGERWSIPRGNQYLYAASIDPDGTAYVGRSKPVCGGGVKLVKYPLGTTSPLLVQRLPRGIDFLATFVHRDGAGNDRVLFSRYVCRSERSDIYQILD